MATDPGQTELIRHEVLKVAVDSIPQDNLAGEVLRLVEADGVSQIVLLRWWDFMRARRNREFRRCVKASALSVPVSRSVAMTPRVLRKHRPPRHMPFDFVIRILGTLEDKGRSAYILGGSPESLRVVEQNLRQTYPGVRFVGRYTGFSNRQLEEDIITAIRKADPDFVLIGPGVPGADRWVSRHRDDLPGGIYLSAPEAFDIFSERRPRTSRTAFKRGLDFLPDLMRRPWRVLRFLLYLWFLLILVVARVFHH